MIRNYTYRQNNKVIQVQAIQFDGSDQQKEAIIKLTGINDVMPFGDKMLRIYPSNKRLLVKAGDYVLRDLKDHITVMSRYLFEDRFSLTM